MTRVLVVEDEESFSDALTFMLEREGYEVAVAADGNAAIEEFEMAFSLARVCIIPNTDAAPHISHD